MEESSNPSKNKFARFLKVYTLVSFLVLSIGLIVVIFGLNNLTRRVFLLENKEPLVIDSSTGQILVDSCGEACQAEVERAVSAAFQNLPTAKPAATQEPVFVQTAESKKISYLPLTGPITTTSTAWVDAVGTDFYLDLAGDYSQNASATWEAFLKVANANGTAYARLYDVTHGIAVNGSEVKVENKDVATQVVSGALSFWAGRNQYRVQIKSLNSFEVTFSSGRVKIVY